MIPVVAPMSPVPRLTPRLARWPAAKAALLLSLLLSVPAGTARAAPPADTSVEEARAAYDKGSTEFDLGHYQNALAAFEKAFTLRHVPALLFNIAQCHRLLGEMKEAATVYRSFLAKDPNNARAQQARVLLAQVESAVGKQAEPQTAPPVEVTPEVTTQQDPGSSKGPSAQPAPQALTEPPPPAPVRVVRVTEATPDEPPPSPASPSNGDEQQLALAQRSGRMVLPKSATAATPAAQRSAPEQPRQRVFTWVAAGGAAVAVGIGAGLGARANSTKSSLQQSSHSGTQVVALQTDQQADARHANAAFAVAAALAVVAATFFVLEF